MFLGRLFSEITPKGSLINEIFIFPGYWVSRESFEATMKSLNLRGTGKLKCNAWTMSALVSPHCRRSTPLNLQELEREERRLIEILPRAEAYVINEILIHPGLEQTKFNIIKTKLTDQTTPYYQDQLTMLAYFATNKIE